MRNAGIRIDPIVHVEDASSNPVCTCDVMGCAEIVVEFRKLPGNESLVTRMSERRGQVRGKYSYVVLRPSQESTKHSKSSALVYLVLYLSS
jgi:hypothetical protein